MNTMSGRAVWKDCASSQRVKYSLALASAIWPKYPVLVQHNAEQP